MANQKQILNELHKDLSVISDKQLLQVMAYGGRLCAAWDTGELAALLLSPGDSLAHSDFELNVLSRYDVYVEGSEQGCADLADGVAPDGEINPMEEANYAISVAECRRLLADQLDQLAEGLLGAVEELDVEQ